MQVTRSSGMRIGALAVVALTAALLCVPAQADSIEFLGRVNDDWFYAYVREDTLIPDRSMWALRDSWGLEAGRGARYWIREPKITDEGDEAHWYYEGGDFPPLRTYQPFVVRAPGAASGTVTWRIDIDGHHGYEGKIEGPASEAPEPATIALFVIGLAGMGAKLRRRKQN